MTPGGLRAEPGLASSQRGEDWPQLRKPEGTLTGHQAWTKVLAVHSEQTWSLFPQRHTQVRFQNSFNTGSVQLDRGQVRGRGLCQMSPEEALVDDHGSA